MLDSQRKIVLNLFGKFKISDFSRKRTNALDHTYLGIIKHLVWCYTDIYVYLI